MSEYFCHRLEVAAERIGIPVERLRALCRHRVLTHTHINARCLRMTDRQIAEAIERFPNRDFPAIENRRDPISRVLAQAWERNGGLSGDSFVYFIQAANGGPIKIGSARLPKWRLGELQTGSPYRLKILGCVRGGVVVEKIIHAEFKRLRLTGEWFKPALTLRRFVATIIERHGAPETEYDPREDAAE